MTRDEIIEQVARRVWQDVVNNVGVVGAEKWEKTPRWMRQGLLRGTARYLDAAGYFEIREALGKIAKARPGEQMETCRTCENLIGIAKHALGGGAE